MIFLFKLYTNWCVVLLVTYSTYEKSYLPIYSFLIIYRIFTLFLRGNKKQTKKKKEERTVEVTRLFKRILIYKFIYVSYKFILLFNYICIIESLYNFNFSGDFRFSFFNNNIMYRFLTKFSYII